MRNVYVYTDYTGIISVFGNPIRAMKNVVKCIPRDRLRSEKFVTGSGKWEDSQDPYFWAKVLVRKVLE